MQLPAVSCQQTRSMLPATTQPALTSRLTAAVMAVARLRRRRRLPTEFRAAASQVSAVASAAQPTDPHQHNTEQAHDKRDNVTITESLACRI
jgi:hypothetical protein